jgi:hypothetical protein
MKTTCACRHEDAHSNLQIHARTHDQKSNLGRDYRCGIWRWMTNHRLRLAIVTFSEADERFRAWLTDRNQINAVRAAQAGGTARISNGCLVSGTLVDLGWNRHLEDVSLPKAQSNCATAVGATSNSNGSLRGWPLLPVVCQDSRYRRAVGSANWNEFSARRYRGRTLQNAVTPTALNVARSLDLCCVQ